MSAASPKKRTPSSPGRRGPAKKNKVLEKQIDDVTGALDSEVVPADFRTLLKTCLPVVLKQNKEDRGSFDAEVVGKGQEALGLVLDDIEKKHADKLAAQNAVIAPSEREGRAQKKVAAESALEGAKAKHQACHEARVAAQKAVHEAEKALKAAEKESNAAERDSQKIADKKGMLEGVLGTEFASLRDGSSAGAQGKKAMDKVLKVGKEYELDSTILQTFPVACKAAAGARSEFQKKMFDVLEAGIKENVDKLAQSLAEAEAIKGQKQQAAADAKAALESAKAAESDAVTAEKDANTAEKDAKKELSQADKILYDIWSDMKKVCDAQDDAAGTLKHFKEHIMVTFEQLKEKVPEPEPVEPEVPEAPLDAPMTEAAPAETAPAEPAPAEPAPADRVASSASLGADRVASSASLG